MIIISQLMLPADSVYASMLVSMFVCSFFPLFYRFVINTSYNSIYMLSENLAGNMYLNFFLLASMESLAAGLYCIGIKR